jgi:hypothetical protein
MMISALQSLYDKSKPIKTSMVCTYRANWQEFCLDVHVVGWLPDEEDISSGIEQEVKNFIKDYTNGLTVRKFTDFDDLVSELVRACLSHIVYESVDHKPKKGRSKASKKEYADYCAVVERLKKVLSRTLTYPRVGPGANLCEMILRVAMNNNIKKDINVLSLIDQEISKSPLR